MMALQMLYKNAGYEQCLAQVTSPRERAWPFVGPARVCQGVGGILEPGSVQDQLEYGSEKGTRQRY